MPAKRIPGPLCQSTQPLAVHDGTLCRTATPLPHPAGAGLASLLQHLLRRLWHLALPPLAAPSAPVDPGREQQTYRTALDFVLRWEGGFVDDPIDPGGRTNRGITQKTYDAYRKSKQLPDADVKDVTEVEVEEIYQRNYWQAAHCPELPAKLAIAQMDTAVNMGVGAAVRLLQRALGLTPDGRFGPKTLAAVRQSDPPRLLERYLELRRARYHHLVEKNPSLKKFLKGWLNRLDGLQELVKSLPVPAPLP
jgi:lysozyme family protein